MSEISAEEKRRILRERRQAKMSSGKATERLNNILTQGSSVKSAGAKSVLDEAKKERAQTIHDDIIHDDPEVPDISSLLQAGKGGSVPQESDMDALMQKLFAGAGGADGDFANDEQAASNIFAKMMSTMASGADSIPETPENTSYQTKLAAYQEYQQKQWKARFLIVRIILHTLNFWYHFFTLSGFGASSLSMSRYTVREFGASNFFTIFISAEIAIISSYFLILSSSGVLRQSSKNHMASKLLSMASAIFPQAATYQSLLDSVLVYWGGASIILGDLMLVVVFFGIGNILS